MNGLPKLTRCVSWLHMEKYTFEEKTFENGLCNQNLKFVGHTNRVETEKVTGSTRL